MIFGLVFRLLHSKYYQGFDQRKFSLLPEGRLMIQLNLFIDIGDNAKKVLDDVLETLKVDDVIANGSIKDMDGKVICYIINGQMATHLFLVGNGEVDDGNNGNDSKPEEFTQLDFGGIIDSVRADCCNGINAQSSSGTQRSCCN